MEKKNLIHGIIIFLFSILNCYSLPLNLNNTFIKNEGQIPDRKILYYTISDDVTLFFQIDKISFVYNNLTNIRLDSISKYQFRFDMLLGDKVDNKKVIGLNQGNSRLNYYNPSHKDGIKDIMVYNELKYENISKGIDLYFNFQDNKLTFYFSNKNNEISNFKLSFEGINNIEIDKSNKNNISINSNAGKINLNSKLFSLSNFETNLLDNNQSIVLTINQNHSITTNTKNQKLDKFQGTDLSWITYLGGSSFDHLYCIDADENSNLLLCGLTNSYDFPVTTGSFQPQKEGGEDAIVLKLDKDSKIDWCTFIGGSAADRAINIYKRDSIIWVSGESLSPDFPITNNAHQKFNAGGSADILIMRLDENGYLLHATYHGGSSYDSSPDLAVDSKYNVWLIGRTFSNNFPVTPNAYYPNKGSFYDAFMISLTKEGDLRYSSYYPADQDILGEGIAIDDKDNVCITGYTLTENLPVSANSYQKTKHNKYDAYIAKFSNIGKPLWATYFGGNGQDYGSNLTVDPYGNFFIFGFTNSTDLPTTKNVFQEKLNGEFDSFIAKFNNDGEFQWVSYFGGSRTEGVGEGLLYQIGGVKSDKYGNILVSGQSKSSDLPITNDAFQSNLKGPSDAFIAKFDVNGKLLYSTYLGGSSNDRGYDVVIDNEGYLVNVGWTESNDFPVTDNAFQKDYHGSLDAYIFRLKECDEFNEYELQIPNDTSFSATKNIKIPLNLNINKGPNLVEKLNVKLRFVDSYYSNLTFSSGKILNKENIGKYIIYELEFTDIVNINGLINLCIMQFDSKLPADFKTKIEIIDFDWSTSCSNTLLKDGILLSLCGNPIQSTISIKDSTFISSKTIEIPLYLEINDLSNIFINYNNVITIRYLSNRAELTSITNGSIISRLMVGNYEECMIKINNISISNNLNIISILNFIFKDEDKENPLKIDLISLKWYEPCIESNMIGGSITRKCEENTYEITIPNSKFVINNNIKQIPIYLKRLSGVSINPIITLTEFNMKIGKNIDILSFDGIEKISEKIDDNFQYFKLKRNSFEFNGNEFLIGYINFQPNTQNSNVLIYFDSVNTEDFCNKVIQSDFNISLECDTVKVTATMNDTTVAIGNSFERVLYLNLDKEIIGLSDLILEFKIKTNNNAIKINSIENAEDAKSNLENGKYIYTIKKKITTKFKLDSIKLNFLALIDEVDFGSISVFDFRFNYDCIEIDTSNIGIINIEDICQKDLNYIQLYKRTLMIVSPNPSIDKANITIKSIDDGVNKLTITNILGDIIFDKVFFKERNSPQLVEHIEINSTLLNSGVYILKLQTYKNVYSEKIFINK